MDKTLVTVEEDHAAAPSPTASGPSLAVEPAPPTPPARPATALGRFLYNHRGATHSPGGFIGYQIIRNITAAVPYGLATAAVWEGFERLAKSTASARPGSLAAGISGISRSPVRDIAMIAGGFTFYRGTLKWVAYMRDYLFNPNHSPEQADDAARHAGRKAVELVKEIAPAEVNSTPLAAFALGMGRRYLDGIGYYRDRAAIDKIAGTTLGKPELGQQAMVQLRRDGKFSPHLRGSAAGAAAGLSPVREFFTKLAGKGSKVWTEAGVFGLSFIAFFELGDRLYKDVQIRRGIWHGEDNATNRVSPEAARIAALREQAAGKDVDPGFQHVKRGHGTRPETFGSSDPNLLRLCFTRIAPTLLGIGAYTFTKRASYLAMGHFTAQPTFLKRALVEGAATATFFTMSTTHDTFGMLWNRLFEPKKQPLPLTPAQQEKYATLLAQVNEKAAAQGRAA